MTTPEIHNRAESEQRVAWIELFFDLIFVFAITQITGMLAGSHGILSTLEALVLLGALWWSWIGMTVLGNLAGAGLDLATSRLVIFGVGAGALLMSITAPTAFTTHGLLFAIAFLAVRLLLWWRTARLAIYRRRWRQPFGFILLVSAPLFVLGALLSGPWRFGIWTLAVLVQFAAPWVLGHHARALQFETSHLPERFGLFIVVVLGESVMALSGSAATLTNLDATTLATLAAGYLIIGALWWTYFHFGASAVRHALESNPAPGRIVRDVFTAGHLIYVIAIVCIAVGLKKTMLHPLDTLHYPGILLAPGAALYLFGFCYARWRMFGAMLAPRFIAGLLLVVLGLASPFLPALAVAGAVAVVLIGLNLLELWIVNTGRPLWVVRLPQRIR